MTAKAPIQKAGPKNPASKAVVPTKGVKSPEKSKGKYADKYKYVRFVERKKVVRKMRKLQGESIQGAASDSATSVEAQLSELRKDLMYIDKYPTKEKYISLFPATELSADCLKKQKEIRAMIVNLTEASENKRNRSARSVVETDDFFASVDNVVKESLIEKPVVPEVKPVVAAVPVRRPEEPRAPKGMHPSWDAKKNERLTGSISQTQFAGSKIVFDEDD